MGAYFEKVKALNEWNWQGSAYQWLFYAGILSVLLFERRGIVKLIFGWLPLTYLLCIYNPLCWKALEFAGVWNDAYFARMFSFMPLMYTISLGVVNLLEREKTWLKGWMKFLTVCAFGILLCLLGRNIFEQDWYVRAVSSEKVSPDTLEVVAAMAKDEDGDIRIAAIDPVTNYIRQVVDYITPYARHTEDLGQKLMADPPDVYGVMKQAGQSDMEYILTYRTDATLKAFEDQGIEPWALTTNLAIYRVAGVPVSHRTLNENRQVISVTQLDENNSIVSTEAGYASVAYEYDKYRYIAVEKYLDEKGNPFEVAGGYASIHREYSSRGLLRSLIFRNAEGEAVPYMGWFELRYDYDPFGRIIRESCYDKQGNPMFWIYGLYSSRELVYNNKGAIIGEKYFDTQGYPCIRELGYAECRREFDSKNRLIREAYFDTEGEPIVSQAGYAAYIQEWDSSGKQAKIIYLDEKNEPTINTSGYTILEREYDDFNHVIRERYYDLKGDPVLSTDGYYGIIHRYDDAGYLVEEIYLTAENEVMGIP